MDILASAQQKINVAIENARLGFKAIRLHGCINGFCTCGKHDCKSKGKHPNVGKGGVHQATFDEDIIKAWYQEQPLSNLGLAPSETQIVIDVDVKNGGIESFAQLEYDHGAFPRTPTQKTGSGGRHYVFSLPEGFRVKPKNTANVIADGIDIRTHGGLIVAAPSATDKGDYEWLVPLSEPLAPCPEWLLNLIAADNQTRPIEGESKSNGLFVAWGESLPDDFPSHPGRSKGDKPSRHDELCRLIGVHLARGDSARTIEAMAMEWGARCDPPLTSGEVLKAVNGISAKEERKREADAEAQREEPDAAIIDRCPLPNAQTQTQEQEIDAESRLVEGGLPVSTIDDDDEPEEDDWPKLDDAAYHGLAGEILRALEPETEADPVGVLLAFLAAFGSAVGGNARLEMSDGNHYANIFPALIGDTASGKGRAWSIIEKLFEEADPQWVSECVENGLSSGEGLVDRIKDDDEFMQSPKTLMLNEDEFSRPMTAMRREGNTLSAIIRAAWDHKTLSVLTRGKSRLRATRPHVSLLVQCTPEELDALLKDKVETANGFSNRFLWTLVRETETSLPFGGRPDVHHEWAEPLRDAIDRAREIGTVKHDADGAAAWEQVYNDLKAAKPGTFGKAVSRARPQALRLSLIYALLDGAAKIGVEHVKAGLAVWRYCEESARRLFGGECGDTGREQGQAAYPVWRRLLDAIAKEPGVTRSRLYKTLPSNKRTEFSEALVYLREKRLAHARIIGLGRDASEAWFPGAGDDDDEPSPKPTPDAKPKPSLFGQWAMGNDEANGGGNSPAIIDRCPLPTGNDEPASTIIDRCPSLSVAHEQTQSPEVFRSTLFRSTLNDERPTILQQSETRPLEHDADSRHADAGLRVSPPEDESEREEEEPIVQEHLEAAKAWANVIAERVKAQSHRLSREDLERLSDPRRIEAIAKRLYLEALVASRSDKSQTRPLEPLKLKAVRNVDEDGLTGIEWEAERFRDIWAEGCMSDDVLWLESFANALAEEDAKARGVALPPKPKRRIDAQSHAPKPEAQSAKLKAEAEAKRDAEWRERYEKAQAEDEANAQEPEVSAEEYADWLSEMKAMAQIEKS